MYTIYICIYICICIYIHIYAYRVRDVFVYVSLSHTGSLHAPVESATNKNDPQASYEGRFVMCVCVYLCVCVCVCVLYHNNPLQRDVFVTFWEATEALQILRTWSSMVAHTYTHAHTHKILPPRNSIPSKTQISRYLMVQILINEHCPTLQIYI